MVSVAVILGDMEKRDLIISLLRLEKIQMTKKYEVLL